MENCFDEMKKVMQDLKNTMTDFATAKNYVTQAMDRASLRITAATSLLRVADPELRQGRPFADHHQAVREAEVYISEKANGGADGCQIRVQILAIACSFSWRLVQFFIPDLLRKNSALMASADVLLVNPQVLRNGDAGENIAKESWAELSEKRKSDVARVYDSLKPEQRARLSLSVRYYDNIPHWHGILVNGDQLLLGRTSWEADGERFHLRAGENTYRLFNSEGTQGLERIDLFKNWFDYYKSRSTSAFST